MKRLRDWVTSIPTAVLFGLTLGVFHIFGLVALLFGRRAFEWTMGMLQRCLLLVFRVSHVRVEVERDPAVAENRPSIFLSNHQSMFDIPIFGAVLFSTYPKYVAKKELARGIPSVSLNLRRGGNALIDRRDRDQATRAIRHLGAEAQERGTSVVLFPEGSRARDGVPRPFKPAGAVALLAAAPDLPVVPTVIDGSWNVFAHNLFPVPFGSRVRIRFCRPIERRSGEDPAAIVAEAERVVHAALASWNNR